MIQPGNKEQEKIIFNHEGCHFSYNTQNKILSIFNGDLFLLKKWIIFCIEDDLFPLPIVITMIDSNNITHFFKGNYLYTWLYTNQKSTPPLRRLKEIIDSV